MRLLIYLTLLTAHAQPKNISDFNKICADSGQQARCCLLVIVRKFDFMLVGAVFKRDAT